MSLRLDEPGWVKIGQTCKAGRRSLWFREPAGPDLRPSHYLPPYFELCAGREGDDDYVRMVLPETEPERQRYAELYGCLTTAAWIASGEI